MWFFDRMVGEKLKVSRLTVKKNPDLVREMYDSEIEKLREKQVDLVNLLGKKVQVGDFRLRFEDLQTVLRDAIRIFVADYDEYGKCVGFSCNNKLTKKGKVVVDDIWKIISSNFREKMKNGDAIMDVQEEIDDLKAERNKVLGENYY